MSDRAAPAALSASYAEHRSFLWALCYRMTGNAADAEDILQETFVRVLEHPPARPEDPLRPWLVRVAVNLARDVLRRRRRRGAYVGPWLPSPVEADEPPSHEPAAVDARYDLLESVSFAFLLALEALSPAQRAVLILRDVFDYTVKETAAALGLSEPNVKTTHHRARRALAAYDRARRPATRDRNDATAAALGAFLRAIETRDVGAVEALLAADVTTTTDGGGEFKSALRPVHGRDRVTRFYLGITRGAAGARMRPAVLNGGPAVVIDLPDPPPGVAPRFALSVDLDADGRIARVYLVSASRKLTAIRRADRGLTSPAGSR